MGAERVSAAEISRMLAMRMEALARELLPAGRRDGASWRVGSVGNDKGGSVNIELRGARMGLWMDHATGEAGDALDLVAAVLFAGDKRDAYRWSHGWLGLGDLGAVQLRRAQMEEAQPDGRDEADQAEAQRRARAMWLGASPDIDGTPAGLYLAARGIDVARLDRFPRSLRFAPSHFCAEVNERLPAMLAAITDLSGAHIATHQTWLWQDPRGFWRKAQVETPKKIRGRFAGGAIRLRKGASGKRLVEAPDEIVAIGEGIETCLSVAVAMPELRVLAACSLGNMGSVVLPDQIRRVVLLADNDDRPKAQQMLHRAVDSHLAAGREVRVARSPRGKDFNDALT